MGAMVQVMMQVIRVLTLCLFPLIALWPAPAADLGHWETLPSAGDLPMARAECAYVRVGNKFYLIGGRGESPIKPVNIFDPATGKWSTGATPPFMFHHLQAVAFKGKIYVLGSLTGNFPKEPPIRNVLIYDPKIDKWTVGPAVPKDRLRGAAGAVVYGGLIYVVNGIQNGHWDGHVAWFDSFNPKTGEWKTLADSPHPRDHFQAAVIGHKLYVLGGRRSSVATNQDVALTTAEVDVYDFHTQKWSTLPATANILTQRAGCTTVVVKGRILVIGGEGMKDGQRVTFNAVEAFDPKTGQWTALAPLPENRHATQAIAYKDRVYLAAGSPFGGQASNTQFVFTPPKW